MVIEERDTLTYQQKNKALFDRQKQTLNEFLKHGAISKQQYDKSLHDLTEKMRIQEFFDIVDENGQPNGAVNSRDEAH